MPSSTTAVLHCEALVGVLHLLCPSEQAVTEPHTWGAGSARTGASVWMCAELCLGLLNKLLLVAHRPLTAVMGTDKTLEQECTVFVWF